MKRLGKGKIIGIVLILALIGGVGYAAFFRKPPVSTFTTAVAERGALVQTVEATGELASIDEVALSFEQGGRVGGLFVEVGDAVERGDLLAVIGTAELAADVSRVAYALQAAEGVLAQKKAGSSAEAVVVSEAAVGVAEAGLFAAETDLAAAQADVNHIRLTGEAKVASSQVSVQTAADALEHVQAERVRAEEETRQDLANVFRSNAIAVRSALSDADEVLGVDNALANDDFEDVLSILDEQALVSATNAYEEAARSRDRAEQAVAVLPAAPTDAELDAAEPFVLKALSDAALTLLYTRQALDATTIDNASFSFSDLSALKAKIDAARESIQAEQEQLDAQNQKMDALAVSSAADEDAAADALAEAHAALASAEADLARQTASGEAAVATAAAAVATREADVAQAEAALAEVEAGPRAVDLAPFQADVSRVRAELSSAEARLAKAEIRSPIAGRVTEVALEVGEQASPGAAVLVVQTTEEQFQIAVDIPESDIAKVAVGQTAEMTFDAFGEDVLAGGTVAQIDPAEKTVEGIVFYETTVYLDDLRSELGLKPGMTADVTIRTSERQDTVIVPQRAVLEREDGTAYVRLPLDPAAGTYEKRSVTMGLRGDGGLVEIIEGLREGEMVILSIRKPS
ncbi:efflux RND transporter periplasmic adaptor subunit [Candidatus Uhrbacteria bacterium]|nr:efflux RND transporter periplasmic adaptor subunit [Candidatus Uhrbacteria bacterium]